MTVYAITDTKKGRTGIVPTYLQTTQNICLFVYLLSTKGNTTIDSNNYSSNNSSNHTKI